MNITFEEGITTQIQQQITKALEPFAVEKIYCTSETCAHNTHPQSRMEVTDEHIDQVLLELGLDKILGIEFKNEDAICFDYFEIYRYP